MSRTKIDFNVLEGFDWDKGNLEHIKKHNVDYKECEEVFVNTPLILFEDEEHSDKEKRFGILGRTNQDRRLAIFLTIRNKKIRVISVRDQGKKDRINYQKEFIKQKLFKERGEY